MDISQVEAYDPAPRIRVCRTVDSHAFQFSQCVQGVGREVSLMVSDVSESNLGQVVDGHAQADSSGDICSSGLELERRVFERSLVEMDFANHLSSTWYGSIFSRRSRFA